MMEPVTVEEWNNLPSKEQNERCKGFCLSLEAGCPAGLNDLIHLASIYRTPIPRIGEHFNIDFNGYDV